MSDKNRKSAAEIQDGSILGDAPVLTVQQREQLKKDEKQKRKDAKKSELKELGEAAKERVAVSSEKKQMNVILTVMIGIMVLVMVALVLGQSSKGQNRADAEMREDATYYLDNSQLAEMGDEGITAAITEVFYTKSDGLRIVMNFANAEGTTQHPTRIQVKLMNGKNEVITNAVTTSIHDDYYVVGGGRKTYELFVPKEYLKIHDDPLSEISYEITVDCEDYHSEDE